MDASRLRCPQNWIRAAFLLRQNLIQLSGQVLFSTAGAGLGFSGRMHDIHPDEDRLIFVTSGDFALAPLAGFVGIGPVEVVVNWFTELRERMGEGN